MTRITAIILLAALQAVMGEITPNPKNFFQDIKGNLSMIRWAHAVNSQAALSAALTAENVMMLEADVVIGNLSNVENASQIPIMAHPPANESDLSLEQFLDKVRVNGTKGIKLDFKTIEAFEKSKPILLKQGQNLTFPVFINADILVGPVNATVTPVDAKAFIEGTGQTLPKSTLSVGWTTRYGKKENITEGRYTAEQIKKMLDTLKDYNKASQSVTYPVRAGLIQEDISLMKTLLDNSTSQNATLTIWSSEGDNVDAEKLSNLIKEIGIERVYIDLPDDLLNKINVGAGSSAVTYALFSLFAAFLLSRML